MEKPRKKELLDRTQTIIHGIRAFASYGIGARIYGDGVDDIHLQKAITAAKDIESMSTWIEGELPTTEEIENCIEKNKWVIGAKAMSGEQHINSSKELAKAIHALITRKLRGRDKCEQ